MTHLWHDVEAGTPDKVSGIVEIPEGSRVKYEIDKESGLLKVDRIIPSSVAYPGNYGFIPRTLADDDDPLDILVICRESFEPAVLLTLRPIGGVAMLDDGKRDDKIICVLHNDRRYENVHDYDDLSEAEKKEIEEFFRVYKRLEADKVEVNERLSLIQAKKIIAESIENYDHKFNS